MRESECMHNAGMAINITIRNVPNRVRDQLAARAARSGRSLQEYLLSELTILANKPTAADLIRRMRSGRESLRGGLSADEIVGFIREDRGPLGR